MSVADMSPASSSSASVSWHCHHSASTSIVALEEDAAAPQEVQALIDNLKKQVTLERNDYIKRRMEENRAKLVDVVKDVYNLSSERSSKIISGEQNVDLLAKRQRDAINLQNRIVTNNDCERNSSSPEDGCESSVVLLGSSIAVEGTVPPIKLPQVKRLPKYITWVYLDRNLRLPEDQCFINRRRLCYDQNGEAVNCSDSDEDADEEEEEEIKEFTESEDFILRTVVQEFGLSDVALNSLAFCFSRKPGEVKERYEELMKERNQLGQGNTDRASVLCLDKDLDAALDSFDNLFCRHCLVFDCKLHGCSQNQIFPAEKQAPWSSPDVEKDPCGPNCYRQKLDGPTLLEWSESSQSNSAAENAEKIYAGIESGTGLLNDATADPVASPLQSEFVERSTKQKKKSKRITEHMLVAERKKPKKMLISHSDPVLGESLGLNDLDFHPKSLNDNDDASLWSRKAKSPSTRSPRRKSPALDQRRSLQSEASGLPQNGIVNAPARTSNDMRKEDLGEESVHRHHIDDDICWKPLEKSLYEKGLEIFGRNSCLIARNMMNGWKTCLDVYNFMNNSGNDLFSQAIDGANADAGAIVEVDGNGTLGKQVQRRSRFLHRRGKVRRLKFTGKSARYPSLWKRISGKRDLPRVQYNPCSCQSPCGKECQCLVNGTCCEKYCGCPKSCRNRFRGCHCTKGQCRSRQCPCFAADRECDPDVCRNCRISCGDGTLGIPFQRADNSECKNMNLLLKQQQKILLGRSDVSGWGAFLKNSVGKDECLGEYTGEVISQNEADRRGKLYDRVNSSYLFNLNDQLVLDACGVGDKLKFANHSPNPNCYAKVMMVGGEHRVGIYAKEAIRAGEEIFYDYNYKEQGAPAWAIAPDAAGSKKGSAGAPSRRAKKHA